MNTPIHQQPFEVAFISPSPNLFGKSQSSMRMRLGIRAKLIPFECPLEATKAIRSPLNNIELVVLDSSAIKSLDTFPQFLGKDNVGLPVVLLLRKGETEFADGALEAGYKALLFKDDDAEFRQLFPGMVLRIIAYFRGERQRVALHDHAAAEDAEELGVPDQVIAN